MTGLELAALAAIVTSVVGAIVALRRFRPERDSLVVTQAQGAATILNDLVQTLYAEIDRYKRENAELREELARRRKGDG